MTFRPEKEVKTQEIVDLLNFYSEHCSPASWELDSYSPIGTESFIKTQPGVSWNNIVNMISEEEAEKGESLVSNLNTLTGTISEAKKDNGVLEPGTFSDGQQKWHQNSTSDLTPLSMSSLPNVNLNSHCSKFSTNTGGDSIIDPISNVDDKVEADWNDLMPQATSTSALERRGTGSFLSRQQHDVAFTRSQQQQNVASLYCTPEFLDSTMQPRFYGHDDITSQSKEYVVEPTKNDVLLGRGLRTSQHEGNEVYRKLIEDNKEGYKVCPKPEKTKVSKNLVNKIRNEHNGRFLRFNPSVGKWEILSNSVARRNVGQALREESTPEFRPPKRRKCSAEKETKTGGNDD